MKYWVDDVRPPPDGYVWIRSVNQFRLVFNEFLTIHTDEEIVIDLDHDSGDYFFDGGDYIKILNWFEELQFISLIELSNVIFTIHSYNPVGRFNMERIITHNKWRLR